MATKEQVQSVISDERAYQDQTWDDTLKGMADWLVYLKGYYYDAMHLAAHSENKEEEVLHAIRKVAALCVACMEQFGGWDQNSDGRFTAMYPGPIPRRTVYHMIDRVRSVITVECRHSINEYILTMGNYLQEAINRHLDKTTTVTQSILVLASVSVSCLRDNGAPRRIYR